MTNDKSQILVSIVCITYNHEPYLRQALDGFLMQKCDFPYEIVLAEDCSTDGTRKICEDYAAKYPDIIRYIWSENNVGVIANERRAMLVAQGKYIAFCEGDDYWTDPLKLQKQVNFMESHPEYSVTFHRFKQKDAKSGRIYDDQCGELFTGDEVGIDVDLNMFFSHWYTQPLTMVYRASCLDLDAMQQYKYYRDMHQIYHLLKNGKGYIFSFVGGVRMVHDGGVSSSKNSKQSCDISLAISEELYRFNHDDATRAYYAQTLQWAIYYASQYGYNKRQLSWRLFEVDKNVYMLLKNLLR